VTGYKGTSNSRDSDERDCTVVTCDNNHGLHTLSQAVMPGARRCLCRFVINKVYKICSAICFDVVFELSRTCCFHIFDSNLC
jgi:hypothetical protein